MTCAHSHHPGFCADCAADAAVAETQRHAIAKKHRGATPPRTCHVGAVWRHKESKGRSRIQRVYYNGEAHHWRIVFAGGTEFTNGRGRMVPNAMPLSGLLEHWEYDYD